MRTTALLVALAAVCPLAQAQTVVGPAEAVDNATVQPAGPRTGTNGKAFFNIEGSANGAFASFGVADFAPFTTSVGIADVTGVTVRLVQSNAAFTAPGTVNFYFASNTTVDIQPGTSPLTYQTAAGEEGVGTQLGTLHLLGSGTFTATGAAGTGTVDTYTFSTFNAAAESYMLNQLNTGGRFRLVAAPNTPTLAATWAGFSNAQLDGPIVSFGVVPVPEPAGVLLACACAAVPMLARRLRKERPAPNLSAKREPPADPCY
jgi:hypothetical protein